MRRSKRIAIACIVAGSVLAAGGALASHGKVGLWNVTVTMEGTAMPDLSKLPSDIQAKMKAAGVTVNGHSISVPHCMTAAEVAMDFPKLTGRSAQSCAVTNVQHSGQAMSADLSCATTGFKGTGHAAFTFDSDTHYLGEVTMQGEANGHPVHEDEKLEGHWLQPDCGDVAH